MNAYLKDSLARRCIFFTGKGGVGKSTIALATGTLLAKEGKRVRFAHWNPLIDTLFKDKAPGVDLMMLEPLQCFREYALRIVKFEKLYETLFDNPILTTFLRAAPGLSDTVMAGKIYDMVEKGTADDVLLVDLPSSGHAYTFFRSPLGVQKLFRIGFVYQEASKILNLFQAPTTRVDLVTLPEELPLTEIRELKEKLNGLMPLPFGYFHLNLCTPQFDLKGNASKLPSPWNNIYSELLQKSEFESKIPPIPGLTEIRHEEFTDADSLEIVRKMAESLGKN